LKQGTDINFWNGNKSASRQTYELELLEACLASTQHTYGQSSLTVDSTDYATAAEEGAVFEQGTDILVTVAGNTKFEGKNKIAIHKPLTKGLLGFRLLMVRSESLSKFEKMTQIAELKRASFGVPETWADAEMFRQNDCNVIEKGSYDDMFTQLKDGLYDYVTLGANEIEEAYATRVSPEDDIHIEPTALIYYPFPLVFYVNADKPELAEKVAHGLNLVDENGQHNALFEKHHGNVVKRLNLKRRKIFSLINPMLPTNMCDFKPALLDS
jgi:hypothetical protein